MKNRYTKLLGNSALFAVANLGTKLMQFLMVPLYTYALNTDQYGTVDVLLTTVTMLTPIITLSVFDAVFRFTMDKNSDKVMIFTNGIVITIAGISIIWILFPILLFLHIPYAIPFCILLSTAVIVSLLQNFSRSAGMVKTFAISGVVNAISLSILNILLLVVFKFGINGYIFSTIVSSVVTILFLIIAGRIWRFFKITKFNLQNVRVMLKYSIPLIPNAFSWWFTNDANRYFILFFVGASGNGLYAVANKVPSILTIFFGIFTQAWQLSAVEEFDSKDNSEFYSNVFNSIIFGSFIGFGLLMVILKPFMSVFASSNFYVAWKFVPFLMLAACYSNLAGFLGTVFLAAKKTASILSTTVLGMVGNLIFNLMLIPKFGVNGAGVGSSLGFLAVIIARLLITRHIIHIRINTKLLVVDHVLVACMIVSELIIKSNLHTILAEFVLFIGLCLINFDSLKFVFHSANKLVHNRHV